MIYKRSKNGGVAQLGERTVRIRKVESSILFVSTKKFRSLCERNFFIQAAGSTYNIQMIA